MGTRSGDLDPAVLIHLHREAGMSFDDLDTMLNKRSGLLGLTGNGTCVTCRTPRSAATTSRGGARRVPAPHPSVRRRLHGEPRRAGRRRVHRRGGEQRTAPATRAGGLEHLGIEVDADRNELHSKEARLISTDSSRVAVLVVPTNEELEIARQSAAVAL